MIKQLTIKNLAIIDDITIDFDENLNVLTGETGAGKSIIIDAISLIFGARANNDIIAYGKENAFISAALYLKDDLADYIYQNYDIDVKDECIITRTLSANGKSSIKINGIITPLYVLNEISSLLVDISGQNESQYLFNHKNHLKLLDEYICSLNPNYKDEFLSCYKEYNNIKKQLDELEKLNENEWLNLESYQERYNELKDFNYTLQDIENINNEYKSLQSLIKNAAEFEEIINYLNDDNNGASSSFYSAIRQLYRLSNNEKVSSYYEKFNSIYLDFIDLIDEFKKEFSNENIDYNRLDYLSDEITKINRLKRKFNVVDLLKYKDNLATKIENINNYEIKRSILINQYNIAKEKAYLEAKKLSEIRKLHAIKLSNKVKEELNELYLSDASFNINFEEVEISKTGIDNVEFYMSANIGSPLKPLIKVASGGEASRIMLGLKSVFTSLSKVETIIFDEIDTGVSGKVALAMGKKMAKIAKSAQVLAITHLPQVAAMSDHHYYIYKVSDDNTTKTIVKPLNELEKEEEVARLLSGDNITKPFIVAAKELISSK